MRLLLSLLSLLALTAQASKPRDAILLSKVESLTLRANAQTTHRRVSALPQLKCVSHPNICAKYAVDVMRCENKGAGYDAEDIQWSCTVQLPEEFKLGAIFSLFFPLSPILPQLGCFNTFIFERD